VQRVIGAVCAGAILLVVPEFGSPQTVSALPGSSSTASPTPSPSESGSVIHEDVRYVSEITIRYHRDLERFGGRVLSASEGCEQNREVVLKKVRSGRDRVLRRGSTDHDGKWRFGGFEEPAGYYYAVARAQPDYTPDAYAFCHRAESELLRFGP